MAEIRRSDRVGYWITFHKGIVSEQSASYRLTVFGAMRVARRGVARRNAADRRASRVTVVREGEPSNPQDFLGDLEVPTYDVVERGAGQSGIVTREGEA
jgi:hypothetical protein